MTRISGVSARNAGLPVKLTHVIALENMRGRFNLALGVGAAGFSEGMVCAVPATTPQSP
jgi:hypothetical protein